MTDADFEDLTKIAREHIATSDERERQRRSFVYGNIRIGNLVVTMGMVDEIGDRMQAHDDAE